MIKLRILSASVAALLFWLAPVAFTHATTIAGTAPEGEVSGTLSMFAGDRFENFRHLERFVPTREMSASPIPWVLGDNKNTLRFTGDFRGEATSIEDFIDLSNTSSLLVLHEGEVIYEHYGRGDTRNSIHASFSMAKSFTSALVGIALGQGKITSLDDPIREYLPELTSTTFDGVTIKHILQMSSGIRFDENYSDPHSDINRMTSQVPPMTYLEFINSLPREYAPGTFNHYASINTQLLGILLVRVTGENLSRYMQTQLWHPLGMEQRGLWIIDEQGYELAMGGMAANARDYARLGLLYLNGGKRGDRQILPVGWAEASVVPDAPHLQPGTNPASSSRSGYQYQWWTPENWDGDFLARGLWGQNIYVHPRNGVVIVKLAADQKNFDPQYQQAYIDYLQQLAQSLSK